MTNRHDDFAPEPREEFEPDAQAVDDARIPPNDAGAEAAVVVTMFVMPQKRAEALALIRAENFFSRMYRTAFEALAEMHADSQPIDVTTFSTHLRESGRLGELGLEGVAGLLASAAAHGNVRAYCRAIRDAWRMRELLKECQRWTAEAYGARGSKQDLEIGDGHLTAQALLERAAKKLSEIASDSATFTGQSSEEVARELSQYIESQAERALHGRLAGVPTGLIALNAKTTGLHAPDLVIVGAPPGMGKTGLVTHAAVATAMADTTVLFVTLEMTRRDIMGRAAGAIAGVKFSEMRAGAFLTPERSRKLEAAVQAVAKLPILWDGISINASARLPDPLELLAKAEAAQREAKSKGWPPLGLVVVDYLQKIRHLPCKGRRPPGEEIVAASSAGVKAIAMRLGVPVLCASSVNRDFASENRKPRMSDLRGSGAIESDADAVWMLYREDWKYEADEKRARTHVFTREAEIIVEKCRNGERGTVHVGFDREFVRFRDLPDDQADEGRDESCAWPQ